MKTTIFNLAICLIIGSGLTMNAQNPGKDLKDSPLVGLWIFQNTFIDNTGKEITLCPGNFMRIDPDGSFMFFLYTPEGGFIVNEGNITLESDSVYIENITYNINSSLMGKSIQQKFKIENNILHKTFYIGTTEGNPEIEIWRRVVRPILPK